jgi:hypothetical protein
MGYFAWSWPGSTASSAFTLCLPARSRLKPSKKKSSSALATSLHAAWSRQPSNRPNALVTDAKESAGTLPLTACREGRVDRIKAPSEYRSDVLAFAT